MRDGKHADGAMVLARKIDMAAPTSTCATLRSTIPPRAPHTRATAGAIYRCNTSRTRSRRLERITHSICTLEFEDHARSTTGCRTLVDCACSRTAAEALSSSRLT